MSLLVVGSVAFDEVETPFGSRDRFLGGAGTHFSIGASYYTDVKLVGVVGGDFGDENIEFLKSKGVDVEGLEVIKDGKTFFWKGRYEYDLNQRTTLDTQLNVFADFNPKLPENYKSCEYVFLANIHPELQLSVLDQVKSPKFVACDTMNLWIETANAKLKELISRVDAIAINDSEARELAGESNLTKAAKVIKSWGPKIVIVKLGQYGALTYAADEVFFAPAMPTENVVDPTGAGDTFAGGFMGYLARAGSLSKEHLRRAVICGSVMASYNIEDFGVDRMRSLTNKEINQRFLAFKNLAHFDETLLF